MNDAKLQTKLNKHLRKMVDLKRSNFGSMRDLIKLNKILVRIDKSTVEDQDYKKLDTHT